MTEEDLKIRITELEKEVNAKELHINSLLDRIEELEDTVLKFETLISDEESKSSEIKWKQAKYSMLEMDLESKEKEIRDLKDRMGFLRKDYIQLQHELEKYTKKETNSTVIRIEEEKQPLETLVKDLQNKINKQQILINELEEKIKEGGIERLNAEILELRQKIKDIASPDEIQQIDSIYKASQEELRKNLIYSNKQIKKFEKQLEKYKKKSHKIDPNQKKSDNKESGDIINNLLRELKQKDEKIIELSKKTSEVGQFKGSKNIDQAPISAKSPSLDLTADLQRKLNKAKIEIKNLQKELEDYKIWKAPTNSNNQDEIIRELRRKLERISNQDHIIDEINKISNQITSPPAEDPKLELRIRELKNLIEDLKTQNNQQRLEISKLRKK
ncbi:MAG: hypothetical protein EU532_02695 [Promethearchaeota archaeon]|nr:MAG: hypothetical protein EU532_02695 [Candidatus Lokiarchaeota archaeon]